MKWEKGRQNGTYEKLLILQSAVVPFDIYLLRYVPGSYIAIHNDPVPGCSHHRVNIELRRAKRGGRFEVVRRLSKLDKLKKTWFNRITWFRPDKLDHYVTRIEEGTRYVLSIGWLKGS
jgi:hypothetical protein